MHEVKLHYDSDYFSGGYVCREQQHLFVDPYYQESAEEQLAEVAAAED